MYHALPLAFEGQALNDITWRVYDASRELQVLPLLLSFLFPRQYRPPTVAVACCLLLCIFEIFSEVLALNQKGNYAELAWIVLTGICFCVIAFFKKYR